MRNDNYWLIKYFDDNTLDFLRGRFDKESGLAFINKFNALRDRAVQYSGEGIAPASAQGQKLAEEFWQLITEFTGGDMSLLPQPRPNSEVYGYAAENIPGLEALADAALYSSAAARIMAVKGLDALSNRPDCAEGARKALIACAGDTSKQVQTVLVSCLIRHPDWESDYLTLLGSKKTAQRSLASRVLAGIGVEQYRAALESALAVEKNAKVLDQITTLLGTPTVTSADGQSPAELAAQILKGGKKRKVQWLLDQPLHLAYAAQD